eukprot:GFUD01038040.1.p1 GENE.GFUD01038040.1~~GFUD01038040.1.p1  ORF type:complete len:146 (+),score=33.37 GFUD01038040.1:58-438(+)
MTTHTYPYLDRSVCDQCGKMFEEKRKSRAWTEKQEIQSIEDLQTKYSESSYDRPVHRSQSSTPSQISRPTTPLLISQINSAYRMSSPSLGVRPYNLPYRKAGTMMRELSGPRRYRIDRRFQSRFYR